MEFHIFSVWHFKHQDLVILLQVLLRWAVQQGVPVLPKSSNPDRIKENAKLFDFTLPDTDMDGLSALDCGHKYCWDPSDVAWQATTFLPFLSFRPAVVQCNTVDQVWEMIQTTQITSIQGVWVPFRVLANMFPCLLHPKCHYTSTS